MAGFEAPNDTQYGELLPSDYLWKEGMDEWKPATDFPMLFPFKESESTVVVPAIRLTEEPIALPRIDVAASGKKRSVSTASPEREDPLASLQLDVRKASRRATTAVRTHATVAGKVASLSAERTKISTVTLPIAYAELGEYCYRSRTHEQEFAELFAKLDAVQGSLAEGEQRVVERGETVAETAMAWAEQGMNFAKSQARGVQAKSLFVQLGKECFSLVGLQSGPEELVTKVQSLKDRLAKIDSEIAASVKSTGGLKTWLMYGGGALLCLAVIGALFGEKEVSGERRRSGGRGGTQSVDRGGNGGSQRDLLAGCPQRASDDYKAGWGQALNYIYGSHEHLLQVRRRVDSGVLVETHLLNEIKTMHAWVDKQISYLRQAARESGRDLPRGEADGYEYGMRRIIKSRY